MYKHILKEKYVKRYFIISIFSNILLNILNAVVPLIIAHLVDIVIPSKNDNTLKTWLVYALVFSIIYSMYNFILPNFYFFRTEIITTKFLQFKILRKYLGMKNFEYEKYDNGKLINCLLSECSNVTGIVFQEAVVITSNIVSALIYLIILFKLSIVVFLIACFSIPFYMVAIYINNGKLQAIQSQQASNWDGYTGAVKHIISNKKQINILNKENYFFDIFTNKTNKWINFRLKYWFWYFLSTEVPTLITSLTKYISLFVCALSVMDGNITIGILLVTASYIDCLMKPINEMVQVIIRKKSNKISFERVGDFFKEDESDDYYRFLTLSDGFIKIKNTEIMSKDTTLLFTIEDIYIANNGIYQLIGKNGSGKTSFLNILLNISKSDNIRIANNGIFEINSNILTSVSYMSYPHLFIEGSVYENILMGQDKPEKFDTVVNLLGINFMDKIVDIHNLNLSLGEQQKISLSRILLSESKLVILDEPLVNIDTETSKKIAAYLNVLKKDKIIIIVSHDDAFELYRDYILSIENKKLTMNPN